MGERTGDPPSAKDPDPASATTRDADSVDEGFGQRSSMAELEHELNALLDDAPLLPDDDEDESDVDFEPPPGLRVPKRKATPVHEAAPATAASERQRLAEQASNDSAPAETSTARGPESQRLAPQTTASEPPRGESRSSDTPAKVDEQHNTSTNPPRQGHAAKRPGLLMLLLAAAALVLLLVFAWGQSKPDASDPAPAASLGDSRTPQRQAPAKASSAAVANSLGSPPGPAGGAAPAVASSERATPTSNVSAAWPATAPAAASGAAKFNAVRVLTLLGPAAIQAGRCRRTGDPPGRLFVRVVIGSDGKVASVFSGHAYARSGTGACIERKIRAVQLPEGTAGGEVVLPVTLR